MACSRAPSIILAVLLCGVILLEKTKVGEGKVCPLYCLKVDYMTCKSSGHKRLPSVCNCCLVDHPERRCTLHLHNGIALHCYNTTTHP
ncbi:hypothetical protein Syun_002980 [Stephania yunnanensis]|uniref:Uncharacterized protein n=1 Tax=Stephania yunnanensis TaxID=152371 RepID=A0AAP0L1U8_9MAGN